MSHTSKWIIKIMKYYSLHWNGTNIWMKLGILCTLNSIFTISKSSPFILLFDQTKNVKDIILGAIWQTLKTYLVFLFIDTNDYKSVTLCIIYDCHMICSLTNATKQEDDQMKKLKESVEHLQRFVCVYDFIIRLNTIYMQKSTYLHTYWLFLPIDQTNILVCIPI